MLQKDLLLQDLQKQAHEAEDDQTKVILNGIIADVISGKYSPRIW